MAFLGMGITDIIFEWIDKKGKKLNDIIDSRKDLIYKSDGTFKEQIPVNEKRYDYTLWSQHKNQTVITNVKTSLEM